MKSHLISKTIFLEFLFCPKNIWLKLHKPELLKLFSLSEFEKHLLEQGNEVDAYARNLFSGGVEAVSTGERAAEETLRYMATGVPAIFQATFIADGFIARNDVLARDSKSGKWDLYEVKGTNTIKENVPLRDHIDDLAFQASVLKRSGVSIGKYFIVHLNKEYVRRGELDVKEVFKIEDETEKVLAKLPEIEKLMEASKEYLNRNKEPMGGCDCIYKGRSQHCTTFEYSNPHVPKYGVHDLARIGSSKKKLQSLVESETFSLHDVSEDFKLSDIQWNQINVHKKDLPIINKENIKEALENLVFPLYFFDYETFAPAIPVFNGYKTYQRIPFQFSLHVLDKPKGNLEHFEYLQEELKDPSEEVAELLGSYIGPKGTIVTWNKSFEAGVNKEIAWRLPRHLALIERINGMLYDLMDIFKDQHYVHPKFRGSTSIKKVLPALIPDFSYDDLEIKEGGQASDAWWRMVSGAMPRSEKEKVAKNLKIYCGLDTEAMYKVWKHLFELVYH
jgi:hypothetical protein